MKQFLLLAALVCSSAYAQQPALSAEENTLFLDSIITCKADNSYQDKRVNTYNANNDITSKADYVWAVGQWAKETETVYSYDENGIQTEMHYRWMNGIWYASFMCDNTFDDKGNVIKKIEYSKQDDQWIYQNMYEYAYDDNGNETLYVWYFWRDGQWVGLDKRETTYDDNGNMTLYVSYSWREGQWVEKSKSEYDDKGTNIFDAQYSDWQDGYWTSLEEKTWDKDGNMTSKANYVWQDGQWVGTSKIGYGSYEYYYRYENLCRVDYIWQDGEWCISSGTKFEYTFNDKGIETSRIGYTWKDGQWQQNNTEFTYDDLGRLICIEDYSNRDGKILYKTEYSYDDNGNISNRIFYVYHSRVNEVRFGMKYEYAYEEDGSMKETRYEYVSDTKWDFVYECKLVANGNMISEIEIKDINSQMPQKYESTYDENGNMLTKTSYKWDDYREDWEGISRYVYAYDDYGHKTTNISYGWDTWNPEGGWIGSTHWECVYLDEHNYLQETIYFWNYNTSDWNVNYYLNYYYSDHTTGIDNITDASRSTAVRKVLVDGQLRIVKGERTYNATGNRIR